MMLVYNKIYWPIGPFQDVFQSLGWIIENRKIIQIYVKD